MTAAAPKRAVESLIRATRDETPSVRANAVWALGRIEEARAVAPATSRLEDASPLVREAAAGTLGRLEAKGALSALVRALRDDDTGTVRRVAAWASCRSTGAKRPRTWRPRCARIRTPRAETHGGMGALGDRRPGGAAGIAIGPVARAG